ncbi:MAG TPA: hypothetical protein VE174_03525 [Actinomycetota bacterium]|nr:hypothetical protein [Actinomycetota bacterium]
MSKTKGAMPLEARPEFGPRAIAFGRSIAEIPGHYRVSLELYLTGDLPGALLHAGHPLMEVLPDIYEDLLEHGLGAEMARSLGRAASVLRERSAPADVNAAFEAATRLGQDSITACVGAAAASPAYQASVLAALARAALVKYSRAVDGSRVTLLPEYQDAYGFLRQLDRMAEGLVAQAESGAEFVTAASRELAGMVPGPHAPEVPSPVAEVAGVVDRLRADLASAGGAILRETPTAREALNRIEFRLALLADVLRHGEVGRAEKLVARIYAEDYADLQVPLVAAAPQIHEELAPLLGRELRVQINREAPLEAVATTVRRVIELLEKAILAIGEE